MIQLPETLVWTLPPPCPVRMAVDEEEFLREVDLCKIRVSLEGQFVLVVENPDEKTMKQYQ